MNYQKIYNHLIEKRLRKPATGYTERHHILPRALGGTDDPSNLVVLSGREHWVAHLLLYRIYKNKQTINACHMMAMRCEERGIPRIKSSRMYESIRRKHAEFTSEYMKYSQKGKGNSQYGTMWISNIKLKEIKKIHKNDPIPEGWVKGMNVWKKLEREQKKEEEKLLRERKQKAELENKIKKANLIYKDFCQKKLTLQEYAENFYHASYVALHKMFKKYVSEYSLTQGKRKL